VVLEEGRDELVVVKGGVEGWEEWRGDQEEDGAEEEEEEEEGEEEEEEEWNGRRRNGRRRTSGKEEGEGGRVRSTVEEGSSET